MPWIFLESSLLLSSQSLILMMGCFLWAVDVGSYVFTGRHLFGGTEYLWNHQIPLWVRCLSFYHLLLPVLLLLGISRFGYDRSALKWQGGICLIVLCCPGFTNPPRTSISFALPHLRSSLDGGYLPGTRELDLSHGHHLLADSLDVVTTLQDQGRRIEGRVQTFMCRDGRIRVNAPALRRRQLWFR
ncbi:MAG: hypothetical protein U0V70_02145 [Terriglobia bacterium]